MNPVSSTSYMLLGLAILAEVLGTSALKASNGFTRLAPSLVTAVAYMVSFYLLSLTLRTLPIGIAYAIWSGVGIVLISAVGWLLYGQRLDLPAMLGLGLIVAGVLVVNLFSQSVRH
ncbi:MAG: QacE family quaternary ammonium compound efflux SMR transporter [Acidovorax sp.]|nr:QacE family quaternary ammonium compound efflux SMR transporter [Acidovorax sp.]